MQVVYSTKASRENGSEILNSGVQGLIDSTGSAQNTDGVEGHFSSLLTGC
jgi:hypothetical protein